MSKTQKCSFPFCFPFTISSPTSYHASPYSHTEITVFFIWYIKRRNLETNSHQARGKVQHSQTLSFFDYRMNGWSACCQLQERHFGAGPLNTQLTTCTRFSRIQALTPLPQTRGISWTTSLRLSSSGSSVHLQIRTHGTTGSSLWREPRKCTVMGLQIIGMWHYKWKV